MLKRVDKEILDAKRLVLGFDAGCFACSELASRIKERVGDKLEVRSLHEPQVEEWRRRALGEDAPWAPTLIEIDGASIRAWTGRRMGLTLGRVLGPVATWRVLQVLGEDGIAKEVQGSAIGALVGGMSRGQFLKGVAGTVVAMSVLPGSMLFPSVAEAKKRKKPGKPATSEQREKAIEIVKNSKEYKKLKEKLERKLDNRAADYDFDGGDIRARKGQKGRGDLATVTVATNSETEVYTAIFSVDMAREKVLSYHDQELLPDGEDRVLLKSNSDNRPSKPHGQVSFDKKHVYTQDGRTYDIKKFKAEVRKESASATPQQIFPPTDPCDECVAEAEDFCGTFIAGPVCGAIGAVVGAGIGTVGGPVGVVGGAVGGFLVGDIACSVFADESEGCENYSRSASGGCYDECGIEG